ncbi:MAG: hypothetical protein ABIE23_02120, partial [archaeon]
MLDNRVVCLNVLPLTNIKQSLLANLTEEYSRVANTILGVFNSKKSSSCTKLHHLVYSRMREDSWLSSQHIIYAIRQVWSQRKQRPKEFKRLPVRFDKTRLFTTDKTVHGTLVFNVTVKPKQRIALPIAKDGAFQRFNSFLGEGYVFETIYLK